MDPRDLHHRLTTAGPDQQRELLVEAFNTVFGPPHQGSHALPDGRSWSAVNAAFRAFIDCGAFVDAAMMLVPDGLAWIIYGGNQNCHDSAELGPVPDGGRLMDVAHVGEASTPALAIAAAALKATKEKNQ